PLRTDPCVERLPYTTLVRSRVIEVNDLEEIAVGDVVLSGGEPAAMLLLDACVRLLPGVMGEEASAAEESFAGDLLEYPQYTRPQDRKSTRLNSSHQITSYAV